MLVILQQCIGSPNGCDFMIFCPVLLRAVARARGQPSQPMGWPGFWSETVLPYLFTRMWETKLQFFEISIHFSSKAPPFLGDNSKTT